MNILSAFTIIALFFTSCTFRYVQKSTDPYSGLQIQPANGTRVLFLIASPGSIYPINSWIPVNPNSEFGKKFFQTMTEGHCFLCGYKYKILMGISMDEWEHMDSQKNLLVVKFHRLKRNSPFGALRYLTLGFFPSFYDVHYHVTMEYYDENRQKSVVNQEFGPQSRTWKGWLFLLWGPLLSSEDSRDMQILTDTMDSLLSDSESKFNLY